MADDRSLDEFLGGGSDDEGDAGTDRDDADEPRERPEGETEEGDDPEPARSTTAFDPDGAACEACGATVRRRWRDDDALVCGDCKAW
jgi:hypothetical protein